MRVLIRQKKKDSPTLPPYSYYYKHRCPRAGIGISRIRPGPGDNLTDAQADVRRMASEEPGPGRQYTIQARKHIAVLRRARPGVTIEIRC